MLNQGWTLFDKGGFLRTEENKSKRQNSQNIIDIDGIKFYRTALSCALQLMGDPMTFVLQEFFIVIHVIVTETCAAIECFSILLFL